ncbi:hypothetical protein [Borrelia sp. RT1S]|uniref:hypothetical protein n=1 Tax=Borrelia sp. RT1S TaxID=2898580 RepID=UPI001E43657D|nr:hypothetical protein [Borrelia sp. RT1S]UGQ17940.1 hypothetical protein LSO05_05770 [Borrelia sp. RT1S]
MLDAFRNNLEVIYRQYLTAELTYHIPEFVFTNCAVHLSDIVACYVSCCKESAVLVIIKHVNMGCV